jgi:hypothetical protein
MKKISLNEELLHQIRLMNFDRSKTLLEHDPEDNPNWYTMSPEFTEPSTDAVFDPSTSSTSGVAPKCNDVEQFRKSYPYCCRYKELAKFTNFSDENAYPFKDGVGWCFYRDARQLDMYIPMDAELIFSNDSFYNSFTEKLSEYLIKETKLFYQTIWHSVDFKRINQSLESSYPDFNVRKNLALGTYLRQRIEQLFPKGSIIKFKINEGSYEFNTYVNIDPITSDLMFNWYYDQSGNQYEQPESVDTRTDYQKFIDEWGMWIQMATLVVASIFVPALAPVWALYIELGLELGTGLLLAQRDFEKGDNVMGMINILTGGISALKFAPIFRGIDPEVAKRLGVRMSKAGINKNTTAKEYEKFVRILMKTDPEASKVLNKMAHFDDYTRNLIQNELPKRIEKEAIDGIKNYILKNPQKLGDVKFWDRLWVMDLKRQFGLMGLGVALDLSPLGKILNNEEKQKYKWTYENIPDYAKKIYDFNAANNPEIQKEIIDSEITDFLKNCKSLTKEDHERALLALQKKYIQNKGGEYKQVPNLTLTTGEELLKNGYVEIKEDDIQTLSIEKLQGFEISSDNRYFYKIKEDKENIDKELKTEPINPNQPEQNK